jgi:GT2 family glycosyltransferase
MARVGDGELDPDAPDFVSPRETDFASTPLIATRRTMFRDLGGFDATYSSDHHAVADFCYRLRETSPGVRYQPGAALVDLEPEAHGTASPSPTDEVRFRERWKGTLQRRPSRTSDLAPVELVALAVHEAPEPAHVGSAT